MEYILRFRALRFRGNFERQGRSGMVDAWTRGRVDVYETFWPRPAKALLPARLHAICASFLLMEPANQWPALPCVNWTALCFFDCCSSEYHTSAVSSMGLHCVKAAFTLFPTLHTILLTYYIACTTKTLRTSLFPNLLAVVQGPTSPSLPILPSRLSSWVSVLRDTLPNPR